jgi:hypothetical protein
MPELPADPLNARCFSLLSGAGIAPNQLLDPDRSRARDARGRFAPGHSGNPRGRPPGIPNPKPRVPDLRAQPVSPEALAALFDRKPHLVRPLVAQFLPLAALTPAERLGIDLSRVWTVEEARRVLTRVWTALSRGEIGAKEAARITRRVRRNLGRARRFARLQRRLTQKAGPLGAALT